MLQNIIFDMGGVLIRWDPPFFMSRMGLCAEDQNLIMDTVFRSHDWYLADLGELEEADVEERVLPRLPQRLHEAVHYLIFHWDELTEPIPGMAQLARDLKAAGLGIYLLSNASRRQPEYWHKIPGSEVFDGTVVSGFLKCLKPSASIYQHLLDTYHLKAEECLFIDDSPANAEGAKKVGMDGFAFKGDAGELRQYIKAQLPSLNI